jgi:hypothetical protein
MAPTLGNFEWKRLIADPFPFLFVWVLGGLLCIVIPRRTWKAQKDEYYESYGYYVEYTQVNRQNYNNHNSNNKQNGYTSYYQSVKASCSWWDFSCRERVAKYSELFQTNDNDNYNDDQVPNWYRFMGGVTEEDRQAREQAGMQAMSSDPFGTIRFVYAWTLVLFVVLVLYGLVAVSRQHNLNTVRWCLFQSANVALLVMLLCVQGVIETDDQAMHGSIYGWHGQLAVLLVYSCFAYLIFSLVAAIAISIRMCRLARTTAAAAASDEQEEVTSESPRHTKASVTFTGRTVTQESSPYHQYKDLA